MIVFIFDNESYRIDNESVLGIIVRSGPRPILLS